MDGISLRPQPLLAHWAPGAILTLIALFYVADPSGVRLFSRLSTRLGGTTLLISLALASFAIGQVLDAFRDGVIEDLFDAVGAALPEGKWFTRTLNWFGVKPVNWDFFVSAEANVAEKFEIWFYSHYMLGFNLGFGLLLLALVPWWRALGALQPKVPALVHYVLVASSALLLYDALRLRSWVADISQNHAASATD